MVAAVLQLFRAGVIVAAVALFDYALLRAEVRYRPGVAGALVVAALAAQIGLASTWAAIGPDHLLARVTVLVAALAGMWAFLRQWHARAEEEMAGGFWVQAVLVVGALLLMRAMRFRTVRRGEAVFAGNTGSMPQFTIRDILLFTTLVCATLAAVIRMQTLSVTHDASLISCVLGAFLAAITLAAVATTLVFQHALLSAAALCGGSLLLGWGIGTAIRYDLPASMVALGAPTALQVAALLLVRLAGYRLVRADRAADERA